MPDTIRLLIADDHKMVREGLRIFIATTPGLEIIGEAKDGVEAVEKAILLQPDVILLDLIMPNLDGINAAGEIKKNCPQVKILVITSSFDESQIIASIKAGALGYLLKDSSPNEIEEAIKKVYAGEPAFPPSITNIIFRELSRPPKKSPKHASLTKREIEILKLAATGLSNQDIADKLFISPWTVRTHLNSVMAKLEFKNRAQITLYALREGLVNLKE